MMGDCYKCMERKEVHKCLTCGCEACINHFVPNISMCVECSVRFEQ